MGRMDPHNAGVEVQASVKALIQRIDCRDPRHFPPWLPVYRVAHHHYMVYDLFAPDFWRWLWWGWEGRRFWAIRWHLKHVIVHLGKDAPA